MRLSTNANAVSTASAASFLPLRSLQLFDLGPDENRQHGLVRDLRDRATISAPFAVRDQASTLSNRGRNAVDTIANFPLLNPSHLIRWSSASVVIVDSRDPSRRRKSPRARAAAVAASVREHVQSAICAILYVARCDAPIRPERHRAAIKQTNHRHFILHSADLHFLCSGRLDDSGRVWLTTRFKRRYFGYLLANASRQFAATHAVKIDGVSLITGSHESPRSRLT